LTPNRIQDYVHWKTGELLYSAPFYASPPDYGGRFYKPGDPYTTYDEYLQRRARRWPDLEDPS
jgi:hypothetical protein